MSRRWLSCRSLSRPGPGEQHSFLTVWRANFASRRLDYHKDTVQLFLITLDVLSTPPSSTIISTTASLPLDALYLTPCPRDLGGVLVTTPNAILHIDQAGKRTGLALNGWANSLTELSKMEQAQDGPFALEGSKLLFVLPEVAILFLQNGRARAVRVQRDGRTISRLILLPDTLGIHASASDLELVRSHLSPRAADGSTQACYVFLANVAGDSELLRIDFRTVVDPALAAAAAIEENSQQAGDNSNEDDDDIGMTDIAFDKADLTVSADIYGSADAKAEALSADRDARIAAFTRLVLSVRRCRHLPAYGPIRSATLGSIESDAPQELVACTGDARAGGLTILHVRARPFDAKRF